ncbi:MAG: hypothetical protein V4436_01390 [Patescibacteria group bacterium]
MFDRNKALIFEGKHWDLYLHANQGPYLGRCFLRYKFDSEGRTLAQLPREAQRERKRLEERIERVYEWIGYSPSPSQNFRLEVDEEAREEGEQYLEVHYIPRNRYVNLTFMGFEFQDLNGEQKYDTLPWGQEYEVPEDVFITIRDQMKKFLFS